MKSKVKSIINDVILKLINNSYKRAFTLIELLVVIVIISILAAIALISYSDIHQKTIATRLKSDISHAAKLLEIDKIHNYSYPATEAEANLNKGLPKSSGTQYQYTVIDDNYYLTAYDEINNDIAFHISSETNTIAEGHWSGHESQTNQIIWKQIATGRWHSCAIDNINQVYCWGYGGSVGELGIGIENYESSAVPNKVYSSGVLNGKNITQIAVGANHTCVVDDVGLIYCWGDNSDGQFGNGSTNGSTIPVAISFTGPLTGKTVKSISAAGDSTCIIASDNLAYCWGNNSSGQLGNGTSDEAHIATMVNMSGVLSGKTIKSIDVGEYHSCAIASDDLVYCWGDNWSGALGNNTFDDSYLPVAVNTEGALNNKTIIQIAVNSNDTSCALTSDGFVYCWGYSGTLGNGSYDDSSIPVSIETTGILSGKTIKSINTNYFDTCVIASDDKPYCWGDNGSGVLGNGSYTESLIPVAVDTSGVLNGKSIKSMSIGCDSNCAIDINGKAYCWGIGNYGNLGNDNNFNSTTPVAVISKVHETLNTEVSSWQLISSAQYSTCATSIDGQAYCWGDNTVGQLGNGTFTNTLYPFRINYNSDLSGLTIKQIDSGDRYGGACVIGSDDNGYCWGFSKIIGSIGYNDYSNNNYRSSLRPIAVERNGELSGKTIKSMSVGDSHACAIADDNNAYCWGEDYLGTNSYSNSEIPVAVYRSGVLSGKTIKQISAGDGHTCAIASDDNAYCWGSNTYGRLGDNSTSTRLAPVAVYRSGALSSKTIKQISAGYNHTCAIASDDQAYCWGYGSSGRLGNNSTSNSSAPVAVYRSGVLSGKTIKRISAGGSTTCVIASDDNAYCWGANHGNGNSGSSNIPVAVDNSGVLSGKTILSISVGGTHVCVIASDNLIYCWGDGRYGQLGDPAYYGSVLSSPAPISNIVRLYSSVF